MWAKLLGIIISIFRVGAILGTITQWLSNILSFTSKVIANSRLYASVVMCALVIAEFAILRTTLSSIVNVVFADGSSSFGTGFLSDIMDFHVFSDVCVNLLSAYIVQKTISSSIIGIRAILAICKGYGTMFHA